MAPEQGRHLFTVRTCPEGVLAGWVYYATCCCGWTGEGRQSHSHAEADGWEHERAADNANGPAWEHG